MARCLALFGVQSGVEVCTGVLIEGAVGAHVPDCGEYGVLDRDDCFDGSAYGGDVSVLGPEVGVGVACVGHCRGTSAPCRYGLPGRVLVTITSRGVVHSWGRNRFDQRGFRARTLNSLYVNTRPNARGSGKLVHRSGLRRTSWASRSKSSPVVHRTWVGSEA
jgi:hypothetical protein